MVAAHPIVLPCLGESIRIVERCSGQRQFYSGVVVGVIDVLPGAELSPAVILKDASGKLTDWLYLSDCMYLRI